MQANNRKNEHILISSSLSSLFTAVLVNPIDIVKIRQQKIQEVFYKKKFFLNYIYLLKGEKLLPMRSQAIKRDEIFSFKIKQKF